MRRLRAIFLLLGMLLLAPLAVLLVRAWQGLERERDARHELVASRVFDESERALGEFLREEQRRPVDGYLRASQGGRGAAYLRPDFVLGHFEIDAAGRISTDALDPAALATLIRDAFPELVAAREQERSADELAKLARPEPPRRKLARLNEEQAPGSTRTLQTVDPLKGVEELKDEAFEPKQEKAGGDSYNTLIESLNRGKKRASAEAQAPEPPASAPATSVPSASLFASDTFEEAESRADARQRKPDAERDADLTRNTAPAEGPSDSAPLPQSRLERQATSGASVAVTSDPRRAPLAGLLAGERRLALYRSVLREGRAYEQGVLVDLPGLTERLESDVLGASGLQPYLDLDFPFAGPAAPALASDRFVYEHRFQEPFDGLSARLSVAPLPEESSAAYLYALGALLVLASTAGLWAVYRRVAAAVHFSERRSNFAAAVSHELKTPLTAIRMYAEMLRDGMVPDEPTRRSYLDTITSESERLTRLINNVLEFSKLERRTHELMPLSESPLSALRAALRTLEPHARAQGFVLREASVEPLPAVSFDRDALQQILFNLIDNALKYARRAERKEIEIACAPCPGGVAVRVRDFGPGVARAHEPHLFEPFYRGGDELTRQTQGTGIGLSLVRELAQRMGAEVLAQNCADGGFAVELRLRAS